MGSCNAICALSGLPIYREDRVKALLLLPGPATHDRDTDYSLCYPNEYKVPALLPLTGQYNDYGGVEGIDRDENRVVVIGFLNQLLEEGDIKVADPEPPSGDRAEWWIEAMNNRKTRKAGVLGGPESPLTYTLIREDVWRGYLAAYDPTGSKRRRFGEDADEWRKWYFGHVVPTVRKWCEKADNESRVMANMVLRPRWGERADHLKWPHERFPGLRIKPLGQNNQFIHFLVNDRHHCAEWIEECYLDFYLHPHHTAGTLDDARWRWLRDELTMWSSIAWLMRSAGKTWLPHVHGPQYNTDLLNAAMARVNLRVCEKQKKRWEEG